MVLQACCMFHSDCPPFYSCCFSSLSCKLSDFMPVSSFILIFCSFFSYFYFLRCIFTRGSRSTKGHQAQEWFFQDFYSFFVPFYAHSFPHVRSSQKNDLCLYLREGKKVEIKAKGGIDRNRECHSRWRYMYERYTPKRRSSYSYILFQSIFLGFCPLLSPPEGVLSRFPLSIVSQLCNLREEVV